MVLRSEFLPRLKFREDEFGGFMPKQLKNDSLGVVNMFSRETLHVSYDRWKNLEVHCNNDQSIHHSPLSKSDSTKHKLLELSFNRLQPTEEHCGLKKHSFGRFVAREAMLAEEYWAASWLRAEAHCESLSGMRHVDTYKRKYAEQVKKEEKNVRRTVLNSVVGTLDLSIRLFVQGETYPGEVKRQSGVFAPFDVHRYAYIANVSVAKYARRQGIASNMLYLAADVAMSEGMKKLFVHVNEKNKIALDLYRKVGFESLEFTVLAVQVVKAASSPVSSEQKLLMSCEKLYIFNCKQFQKIGVRDGEEASSVVANVFLSGGEAV
nr:Peptide alpha-N-acetyltransferase [Ipomoea batatas]